MRQVPNNERVEKLKKLKLALVSAIIVSTILGSTFAVLLIRTSAATTTTFEYRAKWICNAPTFPTPASVPPSSPAYPFTQFLTAWGSFGSGNGQFNAPFGVAVDSSGNVYVTDVNSNRVQKFTSTGVFITTWGSPGSGNGQFNEPAGVAVDSSGNVYVVDVLNNRVQKFTSTGVFITAWGSSGSGNGQFNLPVSVAVDSSGNVYVTDLNNNRVQKFTSAGVFITTWGTFGSGNGQFNGPQGVAVDSSGNVYVVDAVNVRVQKFTNTGAFITAWGSFGNGNGQFDFAEDVAVDSSGNVYVTDFNFNNNNDRVQKFTSTGVFITSWGSFGSGNGQFSGPEFAAVDSSGNVYVTDLGNSRVQKFGVSDPLRAETIGLVPGEYMTVVSVHNPSHSVTLSLRKMFIVSVFEPRYSGFNANVTISTSLKPGGTFFSDCNEILAALGLPVTSAAQGFLVITASSSSLDVAAEYSQQTVTGSSESLQNVPAQPVVA